MVLSTGPAERYESGDAVRVVLGDIRQQPDWVVVARPRHQVAHLEAATTRKNPLLPRLSMTQTVGVNLLLFVQLADYFLSCLFNFNLTI